MWVLTIRSPRGEPHEHVLRVGKTIIGRKAENDIAINDDAASRVHAEVVFDAAANTLTLTDLESTNGTFVNQERIGEPTVLQSNDQIRIGQYTFDVEHRETRPLSVASLANTRLLSRNLLLESLDRYAVLLCDVSERLNTIIDLETALSEVSELIREAMGADKSKVILADSFPRLHELGFPTTIAQKAVEQHAAVIIPDLYLAAQTDPAMGKSGLLMHIHSALCVPVMMGEEVLGLIYVYKTNPFGRPFDQRDLQLAVAISHQAALTIQRTRLLEGLLQLSSALRHATTQAEMLPIIVDKTRDLLNCEGAVLALCDAASGGLIIKLANGAWSHLTGVPLAPDELMQDMKPGQVYGNQDVTADHRFAHLDLFKELKAVAGAPLVAQERILGMLGVGRQTAVLENEVRLLTAVADIAASALHSAALREQTEQRLQRLTALRTIDLSITTNRDLRVTLNTLLEQTMSQLGSDAVSVLLLNPQTQNLEYAASQGFRTAALKHTRLRLGESYAGRAAQQKKAVSVPDLSVAPDGLSRAPLLAAEGFIFYYGVPLVAEDEVKGVLEIFHRAAFEPDRDWIDFLEALAGQAAIAIDNATLFVELQRSNTELVQAYETTLEGWSRALDLRDKETEGHTQRVTEMTIHLAQAVGVSQAEQMHIHRGALLHDIGKMGIPDNILLKPGPLTDEEWKIMRLHPGYAYELLTPIVYLRPALHIPYCHHEKWDGTGYPRGLKGEQIPLAARLFAVADVWDALCSDRPYHKAWTRAQALDYITSQPGKHFDPKVVEMFLQLLAKT